MVTPGGVTSGFHVTVLSVEVEAAFALLEASCATPALIDAITVPGPTIPFTVTVYVVPEPVTVPVVGPAVPASATSPVAKSDTASENTTVKRIGEMSSGSV